MGFSPENHSTWIFEVEKVMAMLTLTIQKKKKKKNPMDMHGLVQSIKLHKLGLQTMNFGF